MNRDPRIADVYRVHLEIAKSKGLWTHTPYTDTSTWSRFGQWGHLETLDAAPASSPKYALMLEHFTTHTSTLRHIDTALGAVPSFTSSASLPVGIVGQAYAQDIVTGGGNGARSITAIGAHLDPGLTIAAAPTAGNLRITGMPTVSGKSYILARVHDADGDPAWRIFTLETFGGPGTLVQSDFRGTNPAQNRPWTQTFVLSPSVTWSGWTIGGGIVPQNGNDAFFFSVSSTDSASTLAQAIADQEYLTATVTPASGPIDLRGAEFRFAIKRVGDHSPTTYTVFSSVGGFTEGSQHYTSTAVSAFDKNENEHVLALPSTAPFSAINASLEFRIYASGARFDTHLTSLTAFKLTLDQPDGPPAAPTGVIATAQNATEVALTWSASPFATSYEIFRRSGSGSEANIGTSGTTAFNDAGAAASTAHLYRVRAVSSGGTSTFSAPSLATTVVFTNDTLVAGSTLIQRAHLIELRSAVNAVRTLAGLSAMTFTDSAITTGVSTVAATHVTELRTALSAALTSLGFPAPTFSSGVVTGSTVQQVHFQELRTLVK